MAIVRARLAALLHVRLAFQHQQIAPIDVIARPAKSNAIFSSYSMAPVSSQSFMRSHT
jgi:hypothetical protein